MYSNMILLCFFLYFWNDILLVLIYIDDILIIGSNSKVVEYVIHNLNLEFALIDLGEFNYFLGLEVTPFMQGLY